MIYKEYLKSPHWLELSNRVKVYWGNRCATCYSDEYIEVHHRYYGRLGFELFTDVIPLCCECHQKLLKEHEKPIVQDAILSMYAGMVWNG